MLLSRSNLARLLLATVVVAMTPPAGAFQPPAKKAAAAAAAATEAGTSEATGAAADDLLAGADIERGHTIFKRTANCISCHGWNGNGMGKNPRSEGKAALLRDTQLDTQGLMDIIRCGVPGTPMPYHDSQAYKDPEVCFGQTMADFEAGHEPRKGKTFREKDLINLVAYLKAHVIGAGETTLQQCEAFFEVGAKNCDNLR